MNIRIRNPSKAEAFTAMFQNIRSITETLNISFSPEKMYIQTMDNSRVSIFEMTLLSEWFCEYQCDIPVTLGVNVKIVHKVLAARDKMQEIHIKYHPDESDQLFFSMKSPPLTAEATEKELAIANRVFDKNFTIPLMEIETETLGIPEMEYQVEMTMPSTTFATFINQLCGFGDSLEIRCSESSIYYIANSQESGSMSVEIKIDDLTEFAIEEGTELNVAFGLTYLNSIVSFGKIVKDVQIKINESHPLCILYEMPHGNIYYYLAPKINEND